MKKSLLALGVIALVAFAFWFSNKNKNEDKVKITILGENSSSIQAMMNLEKDYEALNPNIDLEFKPNTFDDAFTKSNQDFANKTGLYDVVMQYNFSLASFENNDYVYNINELSNNVPTSLRAFEKDLYPNNWKEVGYFYKDEKKPELGEVQVAYPFSAHSMLLMYNKEMFESEENKKNYKTQYAKDLTIPTTWDEFYTVSKFFTKKEVGTYGVCIGGAAGGFLYYDFMNFVYSMGGEVLDKEIGWKGDANTKVLLNSPESLKALKLYVSLKPFNAGNFVTIDQYEPIRLMKEGKTAMTIVWSDLIYPAIKTANGFNRRFGFSEIPGNKSIFIGGAYFISKSSKHPKETYEYLVDLLQPQNQVKLAKMGLCPASRSTYDDPEVQNLPYMKALKKSIERGGVILEAGPDANMISEVITTYVQKCWNNEISPELALQKAQQEIETKRKEIFSNIVKK